MRMTRENLGADRRRLSEKSDNPIAAIVSICPNVDDVRQQLPQPPPATTMTIAEVRKVLVEALHDVRSNQLSPRRASALVQICGTLMRTLPAADLDARVTRLEEQAADHALGVAAELESDSGPVKGSAAPAVKPNGNLGTTSQEQPAEQTTATSGVAPAANAQSQSAAQKQVENLDTEPG